VISLIKGRGWRGRYKAAGGILLARKLSPALTPGADAPARQALALGLRAGCVVACIMEEIAVSWR